MTTAYHTEESCIYTAMTVCKKTLCGSREVTCKFSLCFTLPGVWPIDLSSSAPSIREEQVQFSALLHMPPLSYKELIVHSPLCGEWCTVLVPRNKTPTSISSQAAFTETKMSLGISHCCTREKNNMVFYWRSANNGRKALSARLGHSSKFLFRFPGQKQTVLVAKVVF